MKPTDKIGLYLMNQKGLAVLKTFIKQKMTSCIAFVCVGRDANVENDYAAEIVTTAHDNQIALFERNETLPAAELSLAIGWRWMISDSSPLLVIHDSLLPKYRGFAPLVNMLINGEKTIGASLIWASEEYDRGNIIAQSAIQITYPLKIADAILQIESTYSELASTLADYILKSEIPEGITQDESQASYSLWRDESDYLLDWTLSADKLLRTIHACGYPYNSCKSTCDGDTITIKDATVFPDVKIENRTPGKVIFMKNNQPVVVCGTGLLQLTEMEKNSEPFVLNKFRVRFW